MIAMTTALSVLLNAPSAFITVALLFSFFVIKSQICLESSHIIVKYLHRLKFCMTVSMTNDFAIKPHVENKQLFRSNMKNEYTCY